MQQLNTPISVMAEHIRENLKRDVKMFVGMNPHDGKALIVGGGPSLKESLPTIRKMHDRGATIFALNGVHDWLIERGIIPEFHVILDAKPENVAFVQKPHKRVCYLMAAQCHPSVFEALEGFEVVQWVAWIPGGEDIADEYPDIPINLIGGGNTVGIKTMCLTHIWGFRKLHLFGFDSSYRGDENHAYEQSMNDGEDVLSLMTAGRKFKCAKWMARQVVDFQEFAKRLTMGGSEIKVHGDGLLPWVAQHLQEIKRAA